MPPDIIKVLVPALVSFVIGIGITPIVTHFLYTYKAWKKNPGKIALDGSVASEFNSLHKGNEVRAPRMGGIVVWGSVLLSTFFISLLATVSPHTATIKFDFLSRNQTWIPLMALIVGAMAGLVDDLMVIRVGGTGLDLKYRLFTVIVLATFIGWWFFAKLDVHTIGLPFFAPIEVGLFIIPFFILTSLALYASGVIDGIDGLSGGVFASIFASYTIIAFVQHQINLAAFSAALVGGLLAFLWFNIPPARFYMTDTGTMALTLTLAVIAFMTDTMGGGIGIFVLPIIGGLLVVTVVSDIAQVLSKKFLGRKIFRIAPLHHHFEAIGWPGYKVTMRYWVLSIMLAFLGVIIALVGA